MRATTLLGACAVAIIVATGTVSAATVDFKQVGTIADYNPAVTAFLAFEAQMGGTRTMENFDGAATPGGTSQNKTTGTPAINRTNENKFDEGGPNTFEGLGERGTGNTRTNNGNNIQIRNGNNGGRVNVMHQAAAARITAAQGIGGDGNFLDSNDTWGFVWTLENIWGGLFQGVQAFITDPNDAGGNLVIEAKWGGSTTLSKIFNVEQIVGTTADITNGTIWHFTADLRGLEWDTLTVKFDMRPKNDGFNITNIGTYVIPLPAPALLLLTGVGTLGGLSVVRRRRARASA